MLQQFDWMHRQLDGAIEPRVLKDVVQFIQNVLTQDPNNPQLSEELARYNGNTDFSMILGQASNFHDKSFCLPETSFIDMRSEDRFLENLREDYYSQAGDASKEKKLNPS